MSKTTILSILATLVAALLIFFGVQAIIESRVVEGSSMEVNLHNGERLIVVKAAYWFGEPQRGDVVVFHDPSRPLGHQEIVHRIVGLPNEKVEIRNGQVYINDSKMEEPYIQGTSINRAPEIVPDDSYLIVGDNRDAASSDIVPRNEIIGRVWLLYWPLSDWHLVDGYSYAE
jgi:signal peptidase I